MIQDISSMFVNIPCNGAKCSDKKRKLALPPSFDIEDPRMIAHAKKRKTSENIFDDVVIMDSDFSIDLDLPEVSTALSGGDDIFDWMEDILANGNSTKSSPTQGIDTNNFGSNDIDSFLTLNGSDSCYEEMISLLAEDDCSDNSEENVFKKIQESFISDRLLGHEFISSSSPRTSGHSKTSVLRRSSSFSTRLGRSSRIGIRQGLAKLAKANSRSARTRHMLLSCKLAFHNSNSQ